MFSRERALVPGSAVIGMQASSGAPCPVADVVKPALGVQGLSKHELFISGLSWNPKSADHSLTFLLRDVLSFCCPWKSASKACASCA